MYTDQKNPQKPTKIMPQAQQLFQMWKLHNSVIHYDIQYSNSWHTTLAYVQAL